MEGRHTGIPFGVQSVCAAPNRRTAAGGRSLRGLDHPRFSNRGRGERIGHSDEYHRHSRFSREAATVMRCLRRHHSPFNDYQRCADESRGEL
jgi:hypothetical protein